MNWSVHDVKKAPIDQGFEGFVINLGSDDWTFSGYKWPSKSFGTSLMAGNLSYQEKNNHGKTIQKKLEGTFLLRQEADGEILNQNAATSQMKKFYFQHRDADGKATQLIAHGLLTEARKEELVDETRALVSQDCFVFFGGIEYGWYINFSKNDYFYNIPDRSIAFDIDQQPKNSEIPGRLITVQFYGKRDKSDVCSIAPMNKNMAIDQKKIEMIYEVGFHPKVRQHASNEKFFFRHSIII